MKDLKALYLEIRPAITERISEFKTKYRTGDDRYVFQELSFCILTPQSKARSCANCLSVLIKNGLLYSGSPEEIEKHIRSVRFLKKKSRFLVHLRDQLTVNGQIRIKDFIESFPEVYALRDWLADHIKGIGLKEAGHFLRNIGKGEKIAILDRHVLKNLFRYKVIPEIPSSLSRKVYLDLETRLLEFASRIDIPADHLDFVFWYMEAGEVFK